MTSVNYDAVGAVIKRLRAESGFSQRKLAELSGIDPSYIARLESNKAGGISLKTAEVLARALNVNPDVFFGVNQPKPKPLDVLVADLRAVTSQLQEVEFVPVFGFIPAGYPDLVEEEEATEYVPVPKDVIKGASGKVYALRVSGESLKGDGIESGDILIVEKGAAVIEGKIFAVRLGTDITAKHLHIKGDQVILRASNGEYHDIVVTQAEILGRVIASIKRF
ncbi:MAG: S24 family peptidase [Dehalogenimonas sp.]|nr:S24 family peptidase [Dehalogenimonas sp.]